MTKPIKTHKKHFPYGRIVALSGGVLCLIILLVLNNFLQETINIFLQRYIGTGTWIFALVIYFTVIVVFGIFTAIQLSKLIDFWEKNQ